jgi:hypothetical protein
MSQQQLQERQQSGNHEHQRNQQKGTHAHQQDQRILDVLSNQQQQNNIPTKGE